jgi:hypothetical protein
MSSAMLCGDHIKKYKPTCWLKQWFSTGVYFAPVGDIWQYLGTSFIIRPEGCALTSNTI